MTSLLCFHGVCPSCYAYMKRETYPVADSMRRDCRSLPMWQKFRSGRCR